MAKSVWARVASWFVANAAHVTVRFLPDGGPPLAPYGGYLRLWLAEGFLARQRTWGSDRFPALHGGVSLGFLGADPTTFTTFCRTPATWSAPGSHRDLPITALLPFRGGTVEVEAALYEARTGGPLGVAVELLSGLASLMGPPLSVAAAVAEKVSAGLGAVLAADGTEPVLALHATMLSAGGGGTALQPGRFVVLAAPEAELAGSPVIHDGRLHLRRDGGHLLPEVDHLVVRVECRTERDDWRFPELDALVRAAGEALLSGHDDTYRDLRKNAVVRAWNSPDLTPGDRTRVALLVAEELDALGSLGVVPGPERALGEIAREQLAHPDDPRLPDLTLSGLLGS